MNAPRVPGQFALLRERRFAPFFWTQFLGAANDNIFKNAFVVFVTFEAAKNLAVDSGMIVNLIGAIFILPFMVFSATSGQLADKYEKSRMIRWIKLLEIAIMVIGLAGFVLPSIGAAVRGARAARRALDAVRAGQVRDPAAAPAMSELVGGNGLVESGTFVAILLGTIAGGLVVAIKPHGPLLAGVLSIAVAIARLAREPANPADTCRRACNSPSTGIPSPKRGAT